MKTASKAPFKWTGAKNRLWDDYKDTFFPPQDIDTFVDMFGGGGTISLWVRERYPNARIVLNDNNTELIQLYRCFQDHYEEMLETYQDIVGRFLDTPQEERKAFYYGLREEYCHDWESRPHTENMGKLLFMLQTNFNGMWKFYKKCNMRYSTPPGTLLQKAKFFDLEKLHSFKRFLDTVELRNGDFADLDVEAQGRTWFYADPPYRASVVDYTAGFTEGDQKRLCAFLREQGERGHFVAESNRETGDGFWREHFPDFNLNFLTTKYTAGRGTSVVQATEVLVANYKSLEKTLPKQQELPSMDV